MKLITHETDLNRVLRGALSFVTLFSFLAPVIIVFFRAHRGVVIRSMIVVSATLILFSTFVSFIDDVHFFDAWPLIGADSPVSQPLEDVAFVGGLGLLVLAFLLSALGALAAGKQLAEEVAQHERTNRALGESEEKYRSLLETTDTGYLILDGEGRVVDANPEYVRLTGHQTLDEIFGRSVVEWTATHDQERNAQEVDKCFDLGFVRNLQIDYVDSAGKITPIEINAKVVQAEGGMRILSLCRDISERKLAEEALHESEEELRAIYDSANDAIFLHDVETGRIVDVNQTMCEMCGYTPEEARLADVGDLSSGESPYDQEHAVSLVKKAGEGEPQIFEWHCRDKAGRLFWVEVNLKRAAIGNDDRILAIVRNITERKRAEEALRKSQQMQAKAEELAATGRMAAEVAHEINNPLAGIKNSFHLIRNAVPEDHPDYDMVGRIDREIDRIAHIVRQMYKLYSPRAQTPTNVSIDEAIRDVLVMLQPLCREHEVTIELVPVSTKLLARAPEGSLQQILNNLMANAIQVSPRSGVVNIVAEPVDKDRVRISIRDHGPGIPAEVEAQMFTPFFSVETDGGTKKGIGLGLAIVKNLVESIGGRIEFESRLGKGTCFHVYLPSK